MSAAPKFTPGPWRYFKQGDGTRFHLTARPTTKPGNAHDDFATVDIRHEADARLIAAAPKLYKALRAAVAAAQPLPAPLGPPLTEHVDRWPQWVTDARAALAEASE